MNDNGDTRISTTDGKRRSGYVFISYKSQEDAEAARLQQYLETQGYPCWRAPGSLHKRGTQDYSNDIFKAIRESNCLLFVLSDAALGSDWVQREVNYALNTCHKPVIPFVIDRIPVAKKESNGVYISLQLEKQILNDDLSWKMDVMLPYLEKAFGEDGSESGAQGEKREVALRKCRQAEWKLLREKADFHLARLGELEKMDILRPGATDLTPEAREVEMRLSANEAAEALAKILTSAPEDAKEWEKREEDSIRRKATRDMEKLTYDHGKRFSPFMYSNVKPFVDAEVPWANFVMHSKFYLGQDSLSTSDDDDSSAKAFPYLQKAVLDEQNPWAALRMGECWKWGTGCDVSGTRARFWYEKAEQLGCEDACFRLAQLYYWGGAGIKKDVTTARKYAEEGAKAGNARSYWVLGSMDDDEGFSKGDDTLLSRAEKNYIAAYDKGWSRALYDMAWFKYRDGDYKYSDDRFSDFDQLCWTMKRAGIRGADYLLALNEIGNKSDSAKSEEAATVYALSGCRARDWNATDIYAQLLVAKDCKEMSSHGELAWKPVFDWLEKRIGSSTLEPFAGFLKAGTVNPQEGWDWIKGETAPKTAFWKALTEGDDSVSQIQKCELKPCAEFLAALRTVPVPDEKCEFAEMRDLWELVRLIDWELNTAKVLEDGAADVFPPEFFDESPSRLKRIQELLLSRMNAIPEGGRYYLKLQTMSRDSKGGENLPLAQVKGELKALRQALVHHPVKENAEPAALDIGVRLGEIERLVSPPVFSAAMTFCRKAFDSTGAASYASHFAHLFFALNARHFDQNRNEGMLFSIREILLKGILLGDPSCAPLYLELCLCGMKIGKSQLQADFSLIERIEPHLFELAEDETNANKTMAEVALGMAKIYLDEDLFHMSRAESWGHVSLYDVTKGLMWLQKAKELAQVAGGAQDTQKVVSISEAMQKTLENDFGVKVGLKESLFRKQGILNATMKSREEESIQALYNRIPPDLDAMGFMHVALEGSLIDFVASSDDIAVVFAVYPEGCDYLAVSRVNETEGVPLEDGELSATRLDALVKQREILLKIEEGADIRLAIIASSATLESMRNAWADELEEKAIELVEYADYESFLGKYFQKLDTDSQAKAVADAGSDDEEDSRPEED